MGNVFSIFKNSDHFKVYGEYRPCFGEHVESWTDTEGIMHEEIICDSCGEVRYVKEFSPMAQAYIWRPIRNKGDGFNGCSCQRTMKSKMLKRRDSYDINPLTIVTQSGEKVINSKTKDFIKEYMFDWEKNLVAEKYSIPYDVVTARIEDRSFMKKQYSSVSLDILRDLCTRVMTHGISELEDMYIYGKKNKTRTLFALRNMLIESTIVAVYTNVSQIIAVFNSESMYLSTLLQAEVLLIDDIGKRELSSKEFDCLMLFLQGRRAKGLHNIMAGVERESIRDISMELYDNVVAMSGAELYISAEEYVEDVKYRNVIPF